MTPFDGLRINCRTPEVTEKLKKLHGDMTQGLINHAEAQNALETMLKAGDIELQKSDGDPYGRPRFTQKSKKAWDQKNKSHNPLSGKGKSYANRVEGPDGWGKYVPVSGNPDFLWGIDDGSAS